MKAEAMRGRFITFALVGFFVCAPFVQAAMSSTNYEIRWDALSTGGSDSATSASYLLRDTVEATVAGAGTSTSYQLSQGYRSGIDDQIITFEAMAQDLSSGRSATALSSLTVTTGTSGLSVGDMIALVQDVGASQVAAIGRIASIGAGTITVDAWSTGGSTPTIDGTNDSIYLVSGSSIAYGNLSTSSVATALLAYEVTAANDNGYVVQLLEDGNLRGSGYDIDDVADGSVTAGNEEYGGRSSDTSIAGSTFDTQDTAVTTSFQDIATQSSASFESRGFVTLKAAVSSSSGNVSYSQTLSLVASGNF